MRDVVARRVSVVEVTTATPSPFARSLLFGYTAQFLYDGDAPLAERRAAALTLDPALLAELLGGSAPLADLLDPAAVLAVEAEVSGTAADRQARHREDVADVVRRHGPLTTGEVVARSRPATHDDVPAWLADLEAQRRLLSVRLADGVERWAAVEDAGRLRDALGCALPVGVPEEFTQVLPDPWGDLVRRHARTHGPFTVADLAARFAVGPAIAADALRRLVASDLLVVGRLRPEALGGTGEDHCDPNVLRTLRRRSLAVLRGQVEPVPQQALGVFLPQWQGVVPHDDAAAARSTGLRGVDGLARVIEQLAGFAVPASALESLVLPARVPDYAPAMLDELTAAGEVLWAGHASLAARDGLVSLHPVATADLTLAPPTERAGALTSPLHDAVLAALAGGGAFFLDHLAEQVAVLLADQDEPLAVSSVAVLDALWDLVWTGRVTNDALTPLRARIGGGRGTAHPARTATPRGRPVRAGLGLRMGARPARAVVRADGAGRWSALPTPEPDPTLRAHAQAAQLLDRHGVVTRAVAPVEGVSGQFGAVYAVLAALEQAGSVRRGYFVEHLGGSQFALPGAVDQVREASRSVGTEDRDDDGGLPEPTGTRGPADTQGTAGSTRLGLPGPVTVLAATDPANPYGAALAWPSGDVRADPTSPRGHRPGRTAGAVVVLVAGALVIYLERGGRTVLTFTGDAAVLRAAATALAAHARRGALGRLTLQRLDGADVLDRITLSTPAARALADAGFATTPRGLRVPAR